ncbi:hypothetical protein D0Y65_051552 [Glycine soja]|uniref:Histidine-containing phosphotransfer protein n=1 Tax=Glycine soja TaxID=3848 RepID=A0A445FGR3_GLYSO|nr:hypothetical protein D0Y65_051552 [Glycine soja]
MEVMTMFFGDSEKLLNRIALALEQKPVDFKSVDSNVHQFKGSSASCNKKSKLLVVQFPQWNRCKRHDCHIVETKTSYETVVEIFCYQSVRWERCWVGTVLFIQWNFGGILAGSMYNHAGVQCIYCFKDHLHVSAFCCIGVMQYFSLRCLKYLVTSLYSLIWFLWNHLINIIFVC